MVRPAGIYSVEYRGSSRIIVMQSRPKLNIFHEYKSYVAGNGWSSHAHQLTSNKLLSRAEAR